MVDQTPHASLMLPLDGGLGSTRRRVLLTSLLAALPLGLSAGRAEAINPSDRLCLVLSGTWWVNSGGDFDPNATVPVAAGGFVRRVARTPHYDGVKHGAKEPVVIGIFGMAPV